MAGAAIGARTAIIFCPSNAITITAKMVGSAEILLDGTKTSSPPVLYRTLPLFIDVDNCDESVIVRGVNRILVQASQYACTRSTGDEIAVW
jgi:hypothetical protein